MLTRSRKRAQDRASKDREPLPFIPIDVLAFAFSFLPLRDHYRASLSLS